MIISTIFQLTNQVTEGHCNRLNSATRVTKASLSLFKVDFLTLASTCITFFFLVFQVLASEKLVKHRVGGLGGAFALVFGVLLMAGLEIGVGGHR